MTSQQRVQWRSFSFFDQQSVAADAPLTSLAKVSWL
jgi:hypothetical protein